MFLKNSKTNRHLEVSLPDKKQDIFIGERLASWIIENLASSDYSGFVVFCDCNIANLYKNLLLEIKNKLEPADIILVKPTEANKSIEFLNLCLERCVKANLNRNGCLIAIGGGVGGYSRISRLCLYEGHRYGFYTDNPYGSGRHHYQQSCYQL